MISICSICALDLITVVTYFYERAKLKDVLVRYIVKFTMRGTHRCYCHPFPCPMVWNWLLYSGFTLFSFPCNISYYVYFSLIFLFTSHVSFCQPLRVLPSTFN